MTIASLVDSFSWLSAALPTGGAGPSGATFLTAFLLAACALAFSCAFWALSERERFDQLWRTTSAEQARARAELLLREGLIGYGREAIVVWDVDKLEPVSFGGGTELLDACLAGPDCFELSTALAELHKSGVSFTLNARHGDGMLSVRGCPIGRHAAVFLHPEKEAPAAEPDYRALLDALPVPVWLRDADLRLCWANSAFVEVTGAASLEQAVKSNIALDRSERDLASAARDGAKPVMTKRYAIVQGLRRPLSIASIPMQGGAVAGAAFDLTADPAKPRSDVEGYAHALNQLTQAVAIFGPDKRLAFYNKSYVELWGLSQTWLDGHPTKNEVLDRLRELRRLPEQSDFAAWKRDRLKLFDDCGTSCEELWHLPNGATLRVVSLPRPSGGLFHIYEDVSERLRQESAYNALIKVQQATLDTLQEGVAVFGTDGRLRLHNTAFARQWQLTDEELCSAPHLKAIAERCALRFGSNRIWEVISSAVTAASPVSHDGCIDMQRSDGRITALSLARLPDGATLVTFSDVTDHFRLEEALREPPVMVASRAFPNR